MISFIMSKFDVNNDIQATMSELKNLKDELSDIKGLLKELIEKTHG